MNDSSDAACATDVVRCLYLARVAERLGHRNAAGRWYEKADRWLKTIGLTDSFQDYFPHLTPKALHPTAQGQRSATLGYGNRVC